MIENCKENLCELKEILNKISNHQFVQQSNLLSGASIGQHIRHILEFYLCLFDSDKTGSVNYDKRKRDLKLESDLKYAIYTIDKISTNLIRFSKSKTILLEGNFSKKDGLGILVNSSTNRELAYCMEHSIHHQALIKIGLIEQGLQNLVDDTFGVAPATIRHRVELCVQ